MDLTLLLSVLSAFFNFLQHPETFRSGPLLIILTYYGLFMLVDIAAAGLGFLFEGDEDARLLWLLIPQRFYYRQIMYYVAIKSFFAMLKGIAVGWNKLERSATVTLPAQP